MILLLFALFLFAVMWYVASQRNAAAPQAGTSVVAMAPQTNTVDPDTLPGSML